MKTCAPSSKSICHHVTNEKNKFTHEIRLKATDLLTKFRAIRWIMGGKQHM